MFKGSMGKRLAYFSSSLLRILSFIGLLIAYIVVKISVKPQIGWLNILLVSLTISTMLSGVFNFLMCGLTASDYKNKKFLQILCFIFTLVTGGICSSALTGVAVFTKVTKQEIEDENIFKVKK